MSTNIKPKDVNEHETNGSNILSAEINTNKPDVEKMNPFKTEEDIAQNKDDQIKHGKKDVDEKKPIFISEFNQTYHTSPS